MLDRNIELFDKLGDKPFFSASDIAQALGVKRTSANVLASRYVKRGIFIRLKRDLYVLSQAWRTLSTEQLLQAANMLQVPSYISFMTALSYYDVTTQVFRGFFESAALKRSVRFDIRGTVFNFYKLQRKFYFGFKRIGDTFMSTQEKAFVDAVYLFSFGKYRMDFDSIDVSKLDKRKLKAILRIYPARTVVLAERLCNI